ncbi:MAG TPA: hypothetical protein VGE04_18790 [Chloroflexia bacterium]|jgi:hypothetical protein
MSRRSLSGVLTRLSSAGVLLGLAGVLQPFTLELFRPGVLLLLASAVLFMIASHMSEPLSAGNALVAEEIPPLLSEPTRADIP